MFNWDLGKKRLDLISPTENKQAHRGQTSNWIALPYISCSLLRFAITWCYWLCRSVDEYQVNLKKKKCFQLRTCDKAVSQIPSPTPYSFCTDVWQDIRCCSAPHAVCSGIMGCCTDRAEGWWKTTAIALSSLDAGLTVLIRPAPARWGSILLRWPEVLTQTFQVSVMMPQTCHSCHKTDMTFF